MSSDHEHILGVHKGDEEQFARLVLEYLEPLVRYAYSITGDETAHDVVQDVFLRIWSLGPEWSPSGSIAAYLFTAVRNRALDYVRSAKREARYADDPRHQVTEVETDQVQDGDVLLASLLKKEIEALTFRQQEALRLRYNYGLTVPQVAEILKINTTAAEKLIARALSKMKQRLVHLTDGQ